MDYSDCTIDVRTVQGDIRLTPGDIKDLLDNEFRHIRIGDETIPAKDFLMQDADRIQRDLFNPGVYRFSPEAFEMQEHPMNTVNRLQMTHSKCKSKQRTDRIICSLPCTLYLFQEANLILIQIIARQDKECPDERFQIH